MLRPQDGGEVSRDWKQRGWDFPGSPVVRTLCFYYRGMGLLPGQELRSHMLCSMARKKKKKKRQANQEAIKGPQVSVSSPFLNHENITICMAHWNKQMRQFWPEAEGLRISAHL